MNDFILSYVQDVTPSTENTLKQFSSVQTDNILSFVEEGLLNEVTELLLEYSKTLVPSGKVLYSIFQKLSMMETSSDKENTIGNLTDLLKLQDFLFRNLKEFHSSFRDYIKLFKKDIYHIIQDKIGTVESKWIRENLIREYIFERKHSLISAVNTKHLILHLKSIWKKARDKRDIVEWFEFIGFKENGCEFLDQMDGFISSLDSEGIIDFSSYIDNIYFKRIVLDSYLEGISNIKDLQDDFNLQKIYGYLQKSKPFKKNTMVFSTVLGLLIVDWVQMNPNDLDQISKSVQASVVLPQSHFPLEQGLEEKVSSDIYNGLPELSHNLPEMHHNVPQLPHEHLFQKTISDLDTHNAKELPPLSIINDAIKYSGLPTPIVGSQYDLGIYWSSADTYADSFNYPNIHNASNPNSSLNPDPNLYFNADPRFYEPLKASESSYISPISPRLNKKQKSIDENSSDTMFRTPGIVPSRKKTILNTCECSGDCGNEIASIYMRGPVHELEKYYMIDVVCNACADKQHRAHSFIPYHYVPTTRKRSRDDPKIVDCNVCRKKIGYGGIRPIDVKNDVPEDLTVEFVCNHCTLKYRFCSECGGGGKSRTGKWRPIEMFEKGRRTCALPHVRVGDSQFHTVSYSQSELTGTILTQIQDVFFDSYLSYYAGPLFMELNNQSFRQLMEKTIYDLWNHGVFQFISSPPPKNVSRYIIIEWMNKQHRNKAKAKALKEEGSNRWLKIIKDQTSSIKLPTAGSVDNLGDTICASFAIAEWDHEKRMVFFPQILPRSFFTKSFLIYDHVINSVIDSIRTEAIKNRISMPLYVVLFAKSDNAKIKGIPERLGFFEKDIFVLDNPSSEAFLNELNYPILKSPNALIHVSTVDQLMLRQSKNN